MLAVARGLSAAEIGAELSVSETTVASRVAESLRMTGCCDRVRLVVGADEPGLVL
ncbi:hypothetical protein JN535_01180 [Cellulosimicrobium cellulans]|nr:hypothetical protein [Cellulosimicrobium cellulans]